MARATIEVADHKPCAFLTTGAGAGLWAELVNCHIRFEHKIVLMRVEVHVVEGEPIMAGGKLSAATFHKDLTLNGPGIFRRGVIDPDFLRQNI
ncbi:hypothetical protein GCM10025777_33810 [Membranihabitans marinus]|uniref:Uncharacterized protein n=1 Tax=Nesterenkonia rhizosphaerae TaxID=1348272 RepID=A0ABP9G328_9MICC